MWFYQITDRLNVLTQYQINYNAEQFEMEMSAKGWSLAAICGALGNITIEGQMNPGQCENGYGVPSSATDYRYLGGLGLIGWTGGRGQWDNCMMRYATANNGNWWDGRLQCDLINKADDYDATQGLWGWYPDGAGSGVSLTDYKTWSGSVEDAASIFCWNCEKPGDIESTIPVRQEWARHWWDYFSGHPPTPGLLDIFKILWMWACTKSTEKRDQENVFIRWWI